MPDFTRFRDCIATGAQLKCAFPADGQTVNGKFDQEAR